MSFLSIGKVASATGVSVETVRFYESEGLIEAPQRTKAGYRQFSQDTVRRVRFIQRAKHAGFTLKEIAELLALRREPGTTCGDIKLRATRKIEAVDEKIRDLQRIRDALGRMVRQCSGRGALSACPILEQLDLEEG